MKGYKAFEKGLICRGKQYAENTVFEEEKAKICECGMHFCKNPLDVLDYYPLIDDNGDLTEFTEVEALDEAFTDDEKKYCTKKLKIGAKLDLRGFIKASFDVTYQQIKEEVKNVSDKEKSGDGATLAGGNYATFAGGDNATFAGGDNATLAGGDNATLAGGNYARLAGGNYAKLAGGDNATLAGGNYARLAGGNGATLAGGDNAKLAGGNYAKLAGGDNATLAGGNYARLAGGNGATLAGGNGATFVGGNYAKFVGGYCATIAGGKHSIIVSENGSKAKGDIGSVIIMIKRNDEGEIINYKAIQIDGEKYKAGTMYQLIDGEIVEVENETT